MGEESVSDNRIVSDVALKRGRGRPYGTTPYSAHNALSKAFWKEHIDWKAELAREYKVFKETGDASVVKIWLELLPYLALSEKFRFEKKMGIHRKKRQKVSSKAVAALKALEAQAAKPRVLTQTEQAIYAPDPNCI